MRLPEALPARPARLSDARPALAAAEVISLQGCNVFEWAGCAAAVAGCAALSGPALIACVAAAAPGCVKCVT